ncbi:MAG TPA: hypothetical protein VIM86_12990 [Thermodesulfobacteriota bacterium]
MTDAREHPRPDAEERAGRTDRADRARMRCPACEAPAEWAGHKWRCRHCGWLAS